MAQKPPKNGSPSNKSAKLGEQPQKPTLAVTRRGFLQVVGLSTGLAGLELTGCFPIGPNDSTPLPDLTLNVVRPEDFVVLRVDLMGLGLNASKDKIVPKGLGARFIVVTHPSQHFQEQAFLEAIPGDTYKPVGARLSGPSRVVFRVPNTFTSVDFDVEHLLDLLSHLDMSVGLNATPPASRIIVNPGLIVGPFLPGGSGQIITNAQTLPGAELRAASLSKRLRRGDIELARSLGVAESDISDVVIAPPLGNPFQLQPSRPRRATALETSLEVPYRLEISPNVYGAWAHSGGVVEHKGRVELWHTRLGVRDFKTGGVDEKSASLRKVRALWTRDEGFDPNTKSIAVSDDPFLVAPVIGSDRIQIVHNTSNFNPPGLPNYKPLPVDVNRLMLTGLGAWFDAEGEWKTPVVNLEAWGHRATQGRDHYAKLVYQGYLYPWGHRASLVVITERKFFEKANGSDKQVAYLWQRFFVIVREPLRTLPDSAGLRTLPFLKLAVKQLVTPDLYATPAEINAARAGAPLLLRVGANDPFRFPLECVDRGGRLIRLNAAAVWVPTESGVIDGNPPAGTPVPQVHADDLSAAAALYTGDVARAQLNGQRVALAKPDEIDDTTYEVDYIDFSHVPYLSAARAPGYAPGLINTGLRIEALRQLGGGAATTEFKYAAAYKTSGFASGNEGGLVFEVNAPAPLALSFKKKSEGTGGFLAPSLDIKGLSRRVGPVAGDLGQVAANTVSMSSFFASLDAKLFGVFALGDILAGAGLDEAPKFVTQALDVVEDFMGAIEKASQVASDFKAQYAPVADGVVPVFALDSAIASMTSLWPQITTGISTAIEGQNVQPVVDLIDAFDAHLATVKTELDKLPLSYASGLRAQLLKLVEQVRSVIATNLKPPIEAFAKAAELAKNLTVRLEWRPKIKGVLGIFEPQPGGGLLLSVEARGKDLPGKPAGVDLIASLEEFNINLLGAARFMVLEFQRLQFKVTSQKKPEIDVVFKNLKFDGPLSFVEELRKIIPIDGFSDPPNVDISLEGIKANFTLPLPNIAVGMFSLENLSLSAGFEIPFIGPPLSVNFAFCTREEPFRLTVSMLGGGGFFGIKVSPREILLLEAAIEFGASLAVDFGVASGSISIMAGIYFKMEATGQPAPNDSEASLSGYLRMRGEVDVLGLISASIELYMELTYEFSSHKVVGRAVIEVEVSVLCFSGSVKIEAERKFAGDNNDPTFVQLMEPDGDYKPWNDYLLAFAA